MELKTIIGLEIHIEMDTKSKMFSDAPVSFGENPNTQVSVMDMGFPGSMPTVNKQAVIHAIRVAHALNMTIDDVLTFDRKNYFYSDLPKGYQITQYFRPIGKNGHLTFNFDGKDKIIHIEQLHLEEDTCKQFHINDLSYIDYNRAGIPLLEIVTLPELSSGKEVRKFVETIRSLVVFLGASKGKMEEGNIRVDLNISLWDTSTDYLGNKVEIKNLNSLSNIEKAVDYEVKRQKDTLLRGDVIEQETRRYDEIRNRTVKLREKVDSIDYRYFAESNIPPITLSDSFIKEAIESSPELASAKYERYLKLGLNDYDANLLLENKDVSDYFEKGLESGCKPKLLANWINVEIQSILKSKNSSITDLNVKSNELGHLITLIESKTISNKQAKQLFYQSVNDGSSLTELIKNECVSQINDEAVILDYIKKSLDSNPQLLIDYKNGKNKVVQFIIGLVMKNTQGKANPELTNKLVIDEIKRR